MKKRVVILILTLVFLAGAMAAAGLPLESRADGDPGSYAGIVAGDFACAGRDRTARRYRRHS